MAEHEVKVLAGDVGGTSTRLAIVDMEGGTVRAVTERTYPSAGYPSLDGILRRFLDEGGAGCQEACFGIAGPVRRGRSETTNLPWVVEESHLASVLGLARASLINDLEANAYGLDVLHDEDLVTLQEGDREASGNAAVISAGTGLGEAGIYWDGLRRRPFATEGGHAGFGPADDLEIDLLRFLRSRHDHVSWERVVSGPGLVGIYGFLRQRSGAPEPAWLGGELEGADPAAAISNAAVAGRCEVCAEALDLFLHLYGVEAGDLALKVLATGGVFLGGGIAPKVVEKLRTSRFLESFRAKGRMRSLMETMPVKVIMNEKTALLGAAYYASVVRGAAGS